MGWMIALGVLIGLVVLPLGVSAVYNTNGFFVYILIGPGRIKLFPMTRKGKKSVKGKKTPEKKPTSAVSKQNSKKQENMGGSISDFFPVVESIVSFLKQFRKKLRVKNLELRIILAGDDPADLACNYGRAWSLLGSIVPMLERCFIIKKRDLEVECDFTADTSIIFGRLDLTITVGRLLLLVFTHGIAILKQFFKIVKSRKGGANA